MNDKEKRTEELGVKFKVPVSRMNYAMMVFFLGGTIFWIVLVDVVFFETMMSEPVFFLIFGIAMPILWFLIFLLVFKSSFFNYHEITERKLIISVPPRRISVPLEDIVEIKSDVGSIETEFGESRWDVRYETYEPGKYYFDGRTLKHKEDYFRKGRSMGGEIKYGISFSHSGGKTRIESVWSNKSLILIRAKNKEIITNVPDIQKFVTEALKAIQLRKSSLNL